jgi:para-nitrobenzyl esterase
MESRRSPTLSPLQIEGGLIADCAPDANGIRAFKGLPYAAAPIGALRWRKPYAVTPWDGVRAADDWGPRAMQGDRLGEIDPLNKRMSEDCLYLNVWTPARSADEKLPVMVWIHGGSNNTGAGSQPEYDGVILAGMGVVVVTINYRLDVFGFLAHPDLTQESGVKASGNYGLLDQIAALQWVQKNISALGGDPTQVTVFGESAGAMNISLLTVSPLAEGLFARAIGQSGGSLKPISLFGPKPLRVGEEEGVKFAQSLGARSIVELRARPADEILKAALANPIAYGFGVVDGYVVPKHPAEVYAEGGQHKVPMMVGWTADEGTIFAARLVTWGPGLPSYVERIRAQFQDDSDRALALYPAGLTLEDDKATFAALLGDEIISYGAWAWAEQAAATSPAPIFRYYFTRRPPGAPDHSIYPLTGPGVYHSAELCYVWRTLALRDWPWQEADFRLSAAMASYWVNFAKTGDPNGGSLPRWSAYQPGGSGSVMELGETIRIQSETHRRRYEFLDQYYQKVAARTA